MVRAPAGPVVGLLPEARMAAAVARARNVGDGSTSFPEQRLPQRSTMAARRLIPIQIASVILEALPLSQTEPSPLLPTAASLAVQPVQGVITACLETWVKQVQIPLR